MSNHTDTQKSAYFTPAELSARWKVTPMTLRRWRKENKLRASFIGRGVRFSPEEVARFEREAQA